MSDPAETPRFAVGTGFLAKGYDERIYAITCAHVVNAAIGRELSCPDEPMGCVIVANSPGQGDIRLQLQAWFPPLDLRPDEDHDGVYDIAILAPVEERSWPAFPPLRVEPPHRVGPLNGAVPFHSFGFMGSQNGLPTTGVISAVDTRNWFVVNGNNGSQPFIESGLSGAPAFSQDSRMILGMVVRRRALADRQGFIIPAYALAKAWPLLTNPYPGLTSFDASTAHLFFGRGQPPNGLSLPTGKLREVLDRLEKQRLMAIVGTSGSGKSSLVKAGVAEDYKRRGWKLFLFRPSDALQQDIAAAITSFLAPTPGVDQAENTTRTLIIVDQFEEFFPGRDIHGRYETEQASDTDVLAKQRTAVLRRLLRAVESNDAHCLLTARLDLLDNMMIADEAVVRLFNEPYPIFMLTPMIKPEVLEAIEGPARLFGVTAAPDFAAIVAMEVMRGTGRLPLLQEALRQCWQRLERAGNQWLLRQPSDLAEGDPVRLLEEALGRRGDAAMEQLCRLQFKPLDVDRALLSLVRLVDDRPLRRRLALADVVQEVDRAVLVALAKERIAVLEGEGTGGTVELVHETLMIRWQKLEKLIDRHRGFLVWRDRFDREFASWEQGGRVERDLLRRHDLEQAADWQSNVTNLYVLPTTVQAEYIRASRENYEREERRKAAELEEKREQNQRLKQENRRTRRWLIVATVLLAISSAAIIVIGMLLKLVQERTDNALRQESRALAGPSRQESDQGDHGTALLLALEALPSLAKEEDRPVTVEAEAALRQAWLRNREIVTLVGHTSPVRTARFSPDGNRIITASWDKTARVWDLSGTRYKSTVLEGCGGTATSASFSPDGRRVIIACWDTTARVWDLSGPNPKMVILGGHERGVLDAIFSPDGRRVVTVSDNNARVWDLSDATPTATILAGHKEKITAAGFSRNGRYVVTASYDKTARVWDLSKPTPIAIVLEGHGADVRAAGFSGDGRLVVTASSDKTARVWDLTSPTPKALILTGHDDGVSTASFSSDGHRVITASNDKTARIWDLAAPTPTATILAGHGGAVKSAVFCPDGHRVVTASDDKTARIWDLTSPTPTATVLAGHYDSVLAASFSSDCSRIVSASRDKTARVWDSSSSTPKAITLNAHNVVATSFSPDGNHVITVSQNKTVQVWDLYGSTPAITILEGYDGDILAADISRSGRRVVTASVDKTARMWDLSNPTLTATVLAGHDDRVLAAKFSPDGRRVVTASLDKTARVWDLSAPTPTVTVLAGHNSSVLAASFSPDGRRVVTTSLDKTARVWDLSAPTPTATILEGHGGSVSVAVFSPDGHRVVTASGGIARVWDLSESTPTATILAGHDSGIVAAAFSPNGRHVITTSNDKTARIWDLSGATPTATILEGHGDRVFAASFSPNGRHVVTTSRGTVRVWPYSDISSLISEVQQQSWSPVSGQFAKLGPVQFTPPNTVCPPSACMPRQVFVLRARNEGVGYCSIRSSARCRPWPHCRSRKRGDRRIRISGSAKAVR